MKMIKINITLPTKLFLSLSFSLVFASVVQAADIKGNAEQGANKSDYVPVAMQFQDIALQFLRSTLCQ